MEFPETSIENLLGLGYTEDEAHFLYLAATHSGYFSTRQYLEFARAKAGEKSMAFTQKLFGKGHATARLLLRNGRVYHLISRLIYRAIDREELSNRREHSIEHIRTKLTILDFVLAHLDYRYLETEAGKVDYFCSMLGISKAFLPAKRYTGAIRHKTTDHYFVDNCPLFFVPNLLLPLWLLSVSSIQGSSVSPVSILISWPTALSFPRLRTVRFVYIATRTTHRKAAETLFLSRMHRTANSDPGEEVLRYFSLRKLWEAKQFGSLTRDDMKCFDGARKRFNDAATDIRYQQWIVGRVTSDAVRAEFRDLAPKQEVSFRTELVDGQAALFEASVASRLARTVGSKVTRGMQATFGPDFKPPFGTEARHAEEK